MSAEISAAAEQRILPQDDPCVERGAGARSTVTLAEDAAARRQMTETERALLDRLRRKRRWSRMSRKPCGIGCEAVSGGKQNTPVS